jgi:hypothetical protein
MPLTVIGWPTCGRLRGRLPGCGSKNCSLHKLQHWDDEEKKELGPALLSGPSLSPRRLCDHVIGKRKRGLSLFGHPCAWAALLQPGKGVKETWRRMGFGARAQTTGLHGYGALQRWLPGYSEGLGLTCRLSAVSRIGQSRKATASILCIRLESGVGVLSSS